ncbi:MAG: metal dependent phosphohydrolase [Candidatus Saccharibacteria bacterium]|nr:metal dependent phosphohydrolase [Candidatus Saccharibacteria bacterium]
MTESYNLNATERVPEELGLKDKNTFELYELLQEAALDWTPDQQKQLQFAYELIGKAHADDRHKDRPYTEHLLRVANRIAHYLDIDDPDVIIAGMLHDVVEDHALEIIDGSLLTDNHSPLPGSEDMNMMSAGEQQILALQHIEMLFSPKVAKVVAAVTNAPNDEAPVDYYQGLEAYAKKVATGIEDADAFYVKLCDFFCNGLGVIHDIEGQGSKHEHFIRKYGMVQPIYEARYEKEDIQARLSDSAKTYVLAQFTLGRERLFGTL